MKTEDLNKALCEPYADAVLQGNLAQIDVILAEAEQQSMSVRDIYLHILMPAQERIGQLWKEGKINVAQEHLATAITLQQMERLRNSQEKAEQLGFRAAVASIEGDLHSVGARLMADFLLMDGWQVDYLGADLPISDLLDFIQYRKHHLLVLSVSLERCLPTVYRAISALRQSSYRLLIFVGGRAIGANAQRDHRWDVDLVSHDPLFATNQARIMAESHYVKSEQKAVRDLDQILKIIGTHLRYWRKQRGWSQQKLADMATLDRTYISAVEHGKQNISIAALSKLSEALDISIENLLNFDLSDQNSKEM